MACGEFRLNMILFTVCFLRYSLNWVNSILPEEKTLNVLCKAVTTVLSIVFCRYYGYPIFELVVYFLTCRWYQWAMFFSMSYVFVPWFCARLCHELNQLHQHHQRDQERQPQGPLGGLPQNIFANLQLPHPIGQGSLGSSNPQNGGTQPRFGSYAASETFDVSDQEAVDPLEAALEIPILPESLEDIHPQGFGPDGDGVGPDDVELDGAGPDGDGAAPRTPTKRRPKKKTPVVFHKPKKKKRVA